MNKKIHKKKCGRADTVPFYRNGRLLTIKMTLFLTMVMMAGSYASIFAQKVSLSVSNAAIEDVFTEISRQTKHRFLYTDDVVAKANPISVQFKNMDLDDALRMILKDEFTYRIIAETISIKPKTTTATSREIEILPPSSSQAQTTITGTIRDTNGEILSGATVRVVRTGGVATTDANGVFQLSAQGDDVLEVSYVGYTTQRVSVQNRATINITMQDISEEIVAVDVVSTGYANMDRKFFTGSSTTVSAKDAERAGIPDVSRMLEGQVAGVSVQNVSGTFGAAPKIRVRGATSLSGDNKPLWVVDGIILEDVVNISNEALSTGDPNTLIGSSVAGINPEDIESFSILKDAAATAMYGARAMNGVIVITTKKGRDTGGKANVSYTSNLSTFLKPNYNQFDIMNSAEQMSMLIELDNKGHFNHSSVSRSPQSGIFGKMYDLMYQIDPATGDFMLENTTAAKLDFLQTYARANTDWFDILFKNSLMQDHIVSVSSGSERSQTYISTGFMKDNGQTLGDNVQRYTANLRHSFQMSDKFSAELLFNGSIRDQQSPGTLTRQSDPVYGQYSRDFDINPYSYALNTSRIIRAYDDDGNLEYITRQYAPFNILNELEKNFMHLEMLDMKVQGGVKYNIIPGLTASVDGAYRYAKTERQHHVMEGANMAEAFRAAGDATIMGNNIWLYNDPDFPNSLPQVILPEGGFYNTNLTNLKNYYLRSQLDYTTRFGLDHDVNFLGAFELRHTDRQFSNYTGVGYQFENGGLVNPNYRYFKKAIEAGDPYFGMSYTWDRFVAGMFRGAYSYKERYQANFTTRIDGANTLGESPTARWLPTWNISAKWNIDQEPFFNYDNGILSAIGIRGTYGLTASLGDARNASPIFFNQIARRPYEDEKEALTLVSSLANSELTWEKNYEANVGVDARLFDKVDLTIDVYDRRIFDLIGPIRTSGVGGQFTKQANYADMTSRGLEFTVSGLPVQTTDFRWRTQFNFGYNKNEVTRLDISPNIWQNVRAEGAAREGHSQRGLFSIAFDGLDPIAGYPTFIGTDGVKDTYINLQSVDVDHLVYHGPVDPLLTGGFHNTLTYKNFNFSALFTFAAGNHLRLQPTFAAWQDDMTSVSRDLVNRWMMPGDETSTNIPGFLDGTAGNFNVLRANGATVNPIYPYNAYNYSDVRVARGDFIRLKQVQFGYMLPSSLVSRARISSASVNLVANNLFLLYSDSALNGADPEFFNNGGVAMPIPRQFTLSLKVGF